MSDKDLGFRIDYHRMEDYPHALEESVLCPVNSRYLLTMGGFNTGAPTGLYSAKDVYKKRLRSGKAYGAKKYNRGFSNIACLYDLAENKWIKVPKYPGCPRQGSRAVNLKNGIVAVWGGFSYIPAPAKINKMTSGKWPIKTLFKTYTDGYLFVLNSENPSKSSWRKIVDLPIPWSNFCIAVYGESVWVGIGGTHLTHMYTGKIDVVNEKNQVLGQDLYSIPIDTLLNESGEKWTKVSRFPGTPRLNSSSIIHDDCIYILGGIHPNFNWAYAKRFEVDRYYTVQDNWKYNFKSGKWSEVKRNMYPNSNFGSHMYNLWKNRYVVLMGGGYFKNSKYNGKVVKSLPYKPMEVSRRKKEIVHDELKMRILLIYDLIEDRWIEDYDNFKLFNWTNLPSYVVLGNHIWLLAGEQIPLVMDGRIYGLQSDLFLRADLSQI